MSLHRYHLTWPVLALSFIACERPQPLAPVLEASATAGSGASVKAPSSTNAVAASSSQIKLSWQDNASNEDGFEVHRSTTGSSGPFALLASTRADVTAYSDTGLTGSTQYCYLVRAFRVTGDKTSYSPFSSMACSTTPASAPPAAPFDLTAEAVTWQIVLSWLPNSTDHDGFKIERCEGVVCGETDFAVIATTGMSVQSYGDYSAAWGTTYTYRVRAFNGAGDSAPSNEASATACFVEMADDGTYYCRTN